MSAVVALAFFAIFVAAFQSNRDLFSPAKFFLFSLFVFHVGAFEGPRRAEVWILILLVVAVGAATVLFEAVSTPGKSKSPGRPTRVPEPPGTFAILWALSVPAVASQVYMVAYFGGIEGYILVLANRVVEWRGLGWARTFIGTLAALNLVYLAIGLTRARSRGWWAAYLLHCAAVLLIGLLSGSRSGILNVLALQVFVVHYLHRRLTLKGAAIIATSLVLAGLMLGVLRETFRIDDGEIDTGLADSEQILNLPTLRYGVTPLDILVDAESLRIAYGSTIASIVTNAVPRDLWPEKPDTGGVFFTKEYTGDEWEGASNLTPTLLGEFVINFGWILGTVCYLVVYPGLLYLVVRKYRRMQRRLGCRTAGRAIDFVLYLLWMWTVVALMTGEMTNVLLNFVLTGLVPVAAARYLLDRAAVRQVRRRRRSPTQPPMQQIVHPST